MAEKGVYIEAQSSHSFELSKKKVSYLFQNSEAGYDLCGLVLAGLQSFDPVWTGEDALEACSFCR